MKPSELLTKALTHLLMLRTEERNTWKSMFICIAVNKADEFRFSTECAQVKSRIYERLGMDEDGDRHTADSWLKSNVQEARGATFAQIQRWRRAWMLSMIEEWKAEGK